MRPPPVLTSMSYFILLNEKSNSHSFIAIRARLVATDDKIPPTSRLGSPSSAPNGPSADKVVIDPTKGGAILPKAAKQSKALEVKPGLWIWDGVVQLLEVDLFSAAWEVRHGAAMAMRELLKVQGKCGGMRGSERFLSPLDFNS